MTDRSALFVRLRRLGDAGGTQGNPEAEEVETERREGSGPERRSTIRGNVDPTAATVHALQALFWTSRIADCSLWIFIVTVATPLTDIPLHVEETPSVCFPLAHRVRLTVTVILKPSIVAQ